MVVFNFVNERNSGEQKNKDRKHLRRGMLGIFSIPLVFPGGDGAPCVNVILKKKFAVQRRKTFVWFYVLYQL